MDKILVKCIDTGKTEKAIVVSHTANKLVAILERNDNFRLVFSRKDSRKPYIANQAGLEFVIENMHVK
jgi:hypothetical protein